MVLGSDKLWKCSYHKLMLAFVNSYIKYMMNLVLKEVVFDWACRSTAFMYLKLLTCVCLFMVTVPWKN